MNSITTPRMKPPVQDQSFRRFLNATLHHQIRRQTRLRKVAEAENEELKSYMSSVPTKPEKENYIPSFFEQNAIFGNETDSDPYAP